MDEYNILRKKNRKKSGFATTAILISLAVILLLVAIFVFLLGKIDKKNDSSVNKKENESAEVIKKDEEKKEEEEQQCNEQGECTTIVNCNSKERVFNNNLRDIKDAAVSYFTNERLPKKIGEKVILTLSEMQEEKLVLSLIDSNNNTCDTNKTYVEVTKDKNEYVMKINLSCSDMEDYIIIHLGCYDYCKDTVCEKEDEKGVKEFEYEYKKVTSCTMSEWSTWGEWQTTREKTSDYKKEDTKVVTSTKTHTETKDATKSPVTYNCDKYGSEYKLEGTKCVKRTSSKEVIDATPSSYSYNCDKYPGYNLNGSVCEKVNKKVETIDATKNPTTYYCEDGYKLNGTKCETVVTVTETKPATANPVTYKCTKGYTLDGTNCYRMVTKTDTKDATISCATGYKLTNGKCVKTYQEKETINATQNLLTYSCPSGYKKDDITYTVKSGDTLASIAKAYNISVDAIKQVNNITTISVGQKLSLPAKYQTVCYKNVNKTDTKNATITCPSSDYSKNGTKCDKTTYKDEMIDATPNYTYETVTYNVSCRVPEATTKLVYECGNNGCSMVPQTSYEYVWGECQEQSRELVLSSYSCPSGYKTLGSVCTRSVPQTESIDATITCPSGYTKNGTSCTKTYQVKETIAATKNTVTYSCKSGYTLDGTKCYRMVDKTDTKDVITSCASGYTLSNGKCTKTYQEKETIKATANPITYSCEKNYTKTKDNKCTRSYQKTETVSAKVNPPTYSCKSGYTLSGTKCNRTITTTDTKDATKVSGGYVCKSGYTKIGTKCEKVIEKVDSKDAIKNAIKYSCTSGFKLEGTKCTKVVTEEIKTTYYRYATRTCTGGSTDIKWSSSNNDKTLLDQGYKLTGNKREVTKEETSDISVLDK